MYLEHLRDRCPVLQVQSCKCGCHRKTSHWRRDAGRRKRKKTHQHSLTLELMTSPRPSLHRPIKCLRSLNSCMTARLRDPDGRISAVSLLKVSPTRSQLNSLCWKLLGNWSGQMCEVRKVSTADGQFPASTSHFALCTVFHWVALGKVFNCA